MALQQKEERRTNDKSFSKFRVLTFDCYGTLVDWEGGLQKSLAGLTTQLPETHELKMSPIKLLQTFQNIKRRIYKDQPTLLYSAAFKQAYIELSQQLHLPRPTDDEAEQFATSTSTWKPFPDTIEALHTLHQHFRLAIISNIDNTTFARTLSGPLQNFPFDAVYTAQDIGAYKPSHEAFSYMFRKLDADFNIKPDEILHVAQSLVADHVPAKELGITSVWIARGDGPGGLTGMGGDPAEFKDKVAYSWKFGSLAQLASAVENELGSAVSKVID